MVTINEKKNLQTMRPESGFQISPNWRLIGKRIMISQVIYMTSSPSFFDVTTFLLSSVVIDLSILTNTLQNLAADWKKIDLVFYFLLFSNIGSVFHCFQSPENVLNFEQISETVKIVSIISSRNIFTIRILIISHHELYQGQVSG